MKHFFVCGTKRKILHDLSKSSITLMKTTDVLLIIILTIVGNIQMPEDIIGIGMELFMDHVWM